MTIGEASTLSETLKGAIPTMTDLQSGLAIQELMQNDRDIGEAAVTRYIRERDDFRLNTFAATLASERGKRGQGQPSPFDGRRQARRAEYKSWEAKVDADTRRIDALLAAVPDEELERLKSEIVADRAGTMPDKLLKRLRDGDPRKSPWLRCLIAERLGAVTA